MSFAGAYTDPYKCQEITSLGKGKDAQEAKALLEQIAKQVQPIMRKREWRVNKLSEFSPRNPNLLGLNIGGGNSRYALEIRIRLRPASARRGSNSSFYPYESLMVTMLHELTHIVHGPHDSSFYKLLDELKAECEVLMAKGISGTGQGFDAPSAGRLGQHSFIPQHNPSELRARDVMLQAAEERAKRQRIMATGPQKLGGDRSLARTLSPVEAAAQAAERRARDNVWCPSEQLGQLTLAEVEGGPTAGAVPNATVGDRLSQGLGLGPGDTPIAGGAGPSGSGSAVGLSATRLSGGSEAAAGTSAAAGPAATAGVSGRILEQQSQHRQQQGQGQQQQQQQQQRLPQMPTTTRASVPEMGGRDAAASAVVDLTVDDEDAGPGPSSTAARPNQRQQQQQHQQAGKQAGIVWRKPAQQSANVTEAAVAQELHSSWTCSQCTLLNRPLALLCEACLAERPM